MRRLLVALCTLLALALGGPVMVSAQDATPEPGIGGADSQRTDVRYLLPFGPDGLNPALTEAATVEGVCGFSSTVALDRPDAWDCISADSEIFDPCFEPFMADPEELIQLACVEAPFSTEVTLLTLTEPLVREKEAADPGADPSTAMGQSADDAIAPWDLPWALELANGDQCTLLHGTLTVMAGQTVHYGCVEGGMVLGQPDRSQPLWTVSYLAEGEFASRLVAVAVAWS
jgi:eukaryotic-like serine/threonine-protein kinase